MAYAFWVHKTATPKNWLMRVEGLISELLVAGSSWPCPFLHLKCFCFAYHCCQQIMLQITGTAKIITEEHKLWTRKRHKN